MERLTAQLARIARDAPRRIAMVDGERSIAYGSFRQMASGFAHHLRQAGLHAGDSVALVLPNRIEAAVALYGIWLAGVWCMTASPQPPGARTGPRGESPWCSTWFPPRTAVIIP